MTPSTQEGPGLPVTTIALLMLALGVYALQQAPLRGSRPESSEAWSSAAEEQAPARLWQDPFAAAHRHEQSLAYVKKAEKSGAQTIDGLKREIENKSKSVACPAGDPSSCNPILVLGIMVSGKPYFAQVEFRRKARYAILSALGAQRYAPDDSFHVGYLNVSIVRGKTGEWEASSIHEAVPELFPFEWLKPVEPEGRRRPILVLWLRDGAFQNEPLKKLTALAEALGTSPEREADPSVALRIIGPSGSTTLAGMVSDLCAQEDAAPTALSGFGIYSYAATASDSVLLEEGCPGLNPADRTVPALFASKAPKVPFVRTLRTDKDLALALIKELERRAVCPAGKYREAEAGECQAVERADPDDIAVIAEWDTLYGRSLPGAFREAVEDYSDQPGAGEKFVHGFSYLRGLDGVLPGKADEETASKAGREERVPAQVEPGPHRPVGPGQHDYLLRLAGEIDALDGKLRDQGRQVHAIGVLGSDVYDKLLVLQALRPEFEEVIFFTTDLEAALFHPGELKATRNLVVVSSYGLSLHPKQQAGIPPFRDSYQTSLFLTIPLALRGIEMQPPASFSPAALQAELDARLVPRIYEIGRHGAVELSLAEGSSMSSTGLLPLPIHPERPSGFPSATEGWCLARILFLAVLLILIYSDGVRYALARSWNRIWKQPLTVKLAVLVALILIAWLVGVTLDDLGERLIAERDTGEPFSWQDGVSVWPSQVLRVLATAAAIYFLFRAHRVLASNDELLERDFFKSSTALSKRHVSPAQHGPRSENGLSLGKRLLSKLDVFRGPITLRSLDQAVEPKTEHVNALEVWRVHQRLARFFPTTLRVLGGTALFFILGRFLILHFGEPFVPVRGEVAGEIDRAIMPWLTIPFLLALIFRVVDSTRLCVRLVDGLAKRSTRCWPEETLKRFSGGDDARNAYLAAWLDTLFTARRTEAVGNLIYFPFAVMLLLLMSRWTYFDDWHANAGLTLTIGASLLYAVISAVLLHRSAHRVRRSAVEQIGDAMMKARSGSDEASRARAEQAKLALDEVRAIRQGAFVPLAAHPLTRTGILILTAVGWLVLDARTL